MTWLRFAMVASCLATLVGPGTSVAENEMSAVLPFEATIMLAPGSTPNGTNPSVRGMDAKGWMVIRPINGGTDVQFFVRGARPNTLYTIWTVFKPLRWCTASQLQNAPGCPSAFGPSPATATCPAILSANILPGFCNFDPGALPFYPEAGLVAPTASMAKAFTSGMGLDPGATFYTNGRGDGQVHVILDYNVLGTTYDDGPPVGNATTVAQCATPGVPAGPTYASGGAPIGSGNCPPITANGVTTTPRFTVTSSWLRKFIIQTDDPATECANYVPAEPGSVFWQCIDPATVNPQNGTGLPRVWRYPFDHFRLAAHPDELTHGFIGGSRFEHAIDMVGRRCALTGSCP